MAVLTEPTTESPIQSPIGFEGFEKRLEITFSPAPIFTDPHGLGLRALTRSQLDSILGPACCTIVAQLSNCELDSYVLSESSLFVYPLKIILKTCGTTKLLLSIPPVLELAESLSLCVDSVMYSRGSFIFPNAQPAPHRSFAEEVAVLKCFFKDLTGAAYVIGDPRTVNRKWHVYSACSKPSHWNGQTDVIGIEMCMTGLAKKRSATFFKSSDGKTRSAHEMTENSGINKIIPGHEICDFNFDPCGYSMNGIDAAAYSTVHVTPEDGFSYASYEASGFNPRSVKFDLLIKKVLECFEPQEFSVAVTCGAHDKWWTKGSAFVKGYLGRPIVEQELPGGSVVVYRSYKKEQRGHTVVHCPFKVAKACREEAAEAVEEVVDEA
ncbi:S-adenosylmethionine decarboxylase proenzyme-like [Punica granatum]|uniref:adenosylmethionine decarboxylase n=2 Tax=Punica granatum TaxID=22663 RepID=A0A218XYC0_PUNGR|nr:S-adenosylmethionine decarboxylase proenzyme-like [Punica granatum]OWM89974.1 hypothetical protein CDL15_Pgr012611 [Punica granatum]PKI43222.1 hypothetical protein CRG98_036388 [Punica granatum]